MFGRTMSNMRKRHLLATLLLTLPVWSGPIYRIDFSGRITTGQVRAILDDQSSFILPFEPGGVINGVVLMDLSLAPTPSVSSGPSQIDTRFTDTGAANPVWISGQVTLPLPALPPRALPVPNSFSLAPLLPPPGATVDQVPLRDLDFIWTAEPPPCCDAVNVGIAFQNTWHTDVDQRFKGIILGLLLTSPVSFLPEPGTFPANFDIANVAVTSSFSVTAFDRKQVLTPPLFGIERNYLIDVRFTVDHATGGIEGGSNAPATGGGVVVTPTPEPGTWLAGLALAGLGLARGKILRRWRA